MSYESRFSRLSRSVSVKVSEKILLLLARSSFVDRSVVLHMSTTLEEMMVVTVDEDHCMFHVITKGIAPPGSLVTWISQGAAWPFRQTPR